MSTFGPEDVEPKPAEAKARKNGSIPRLPVRAPLGELRDWLTRALNPPDGFRFESFERRGDRLSASCSLSLRTPVGGLVTYRFPEQRALARPGNLRSSVVAITDGLCWVPPLNTNEAADVWLALCHVGSVEGREDEVETFRDRLDAFAAVCEVEERFTFASHGRLDALLYLQGRGAFERRHARMMGELDERRWDRRPVMLIDRESRERWVRVGELSMYLRHVADFALGVGTLDGLISEIGGERRRYEVREGRVHPHANVYRLPSDDDAPNERNDECLPS